jgi:hypothetical protein
MRCSYITGAADPSDHVPMGTINTSIERIILPVLIAILDLFIKKPSTWISRSIGYFCPVLTADGKVDFAPK